MQYDEEYEVSYKLQPVHPWVLFDELPYIPIRHPLQHYGEWGGSICDSKERDNVGMRQSFPHGNFLVKNLKKRVHLSGQNSRIATT